MFDTNNQKKILVENKLFVINYEKTLEYQTKRNPLSLIERGFLYM